MWYDYREMNSLVVIRMARDYSHEYEASKGKSKFIRIRMEPSVFDDFQGKCEDEGINMSLLLKSCIDAYLDNSLTYEDGKLKIN